ncbi:M43 family zinc metalloprotease [Parapedobacter koreensis]|uniref:M43 family zinc metalloprotease n=1 Tax=Parapedobacter koreensis TaxID=332977 RepID=UPI0015A61678|nr:M43 family zinc metalloprotease [Parapedobacter koreensis]
MPGQDTTVTKVVLQLSKTTLFADGKDTTTINVEAFNRADEPVRGASVTVFIDGTVFNGRNFSTAQAGRYTFTAKSGNMTSDAVELNALDISHKVAHISVATDVAVVIAGGYNHAVFNVTLLDSAGRELTEDIPINLYAGDTLLDSTIFEADQPGNYTITARVMDVVSDPVTIRAVEAREAIGRIGLVSDTRAIIADGKSRARLAVAIYDKQDKELDIRYDVYINEQEQVLETASFSTVSPGQYNVQVKIGTVSSEVLLINAREPKNYSVITIPVVFHVYEDLVAKQWSGNTRPYDLSPEFFKQWVDTLNAYFGQRSTANPNAVDTRIRFRLATVGPGNKPLAEAGIHRLDGSQFDDGGTFDRANDGVIGTSEADNMAAAVNWDLSEYINIHVVGNTNWRGIRNASWADLPLTGRSNELSGLSTGTNATNRIILRYVDVANHMGTTLGHEMGHYLGLLHTFSEDDCLTNDYCPDTYSYVYESDPIEPCDDNLGWTILDNFMGYSNETGQAAMNFTYDQRERMRYVLKHSNSLKELEYSKK